MRVRHTLIAAALTAVLGGVIVPALAEAPDEARTMPDRDMGMGHMGHGMMSGGMMSGDLMGGCMSMMRSMNSTDGRPNSQWHKHPPADQSVRN
jgi:hypothetical protein